MSIQLAPLELLVPASPYKSSSLVDVARDYAHIAPSATPFTFVDFSFAESQDRGITYAQLDERARRIAALLQMTGKIGDSVLLLYPAGLDYLCALFGCLYAGMVAVPSYPPLNPRLRDRLCSVAADCGATAALTTAATLTQCGEAVNALPTLRWLTSDGALDHLEGEWCDPFVSREHIAILQYTSGSTGTPKGVVVTHRNLLHNAYLIALHLQFRPGDHHLTWLPPYHDMGLIGALLGSFCAGVTVSFMAPAAFLRRPERWFSELSKRRCTVSGAPNFAYELCIDKVPDEALHEFDLSCWQLAYSGAEPVRADTLTRFAARFGQCGFNRHAFYPCYGMAETTLFVTGKRRDEAPRTKWVDSVAYANEGRAIASEPSGAGVPAREFVSCGETAIDLDVRIVAVESRQELPAGRVGEIWVAGASVTAGYWQRKEETAAAFNTRLAGRSEAYLRTGDLGFMDEGQLYVSGRLKDLIIIRGVNHYPHDIEHTVDECHDAVRPGCGIAFSVGVRNDEQLVFVQEVGRRDELRADEIISCMRGAIYTHHGIQPYAVVLIANGSIPKTTSGKLSRRPCRQQFLEGRLQVVSQWINAAFTGENAASATDTTATVAA